VVLLATLAISVGVKKHSHKCLLFTKTIISSLPHRIFTVKRIILSHFFNTKIRPASSANGYVRWNFFIISFFFFTFIKSWDKHCEVNLLSKEDAENGEMCGSACGECFLISGPKGASVWVVNEIADAPSGEREW